MDTGHFTNLKTKMLDHTNHLRNPGLSYISKDNVLVDSQFIGYRDIEKKLPIEKNTVFRIYSMTKPITTVVALMLIQEGKLDFKDTMTQFLPDLSNLKVYVSQTTDRFATEELKREILIQDLLTCQAGFSYGFIASHPVDRLYRDLLRPRVTALTKSEMLMELVTIPLYHQPGTQWHYGLELDVLGFILEEICQRDLNKIFYEYLFSKLSMFSTGFYVNSDELKNFAKIYTRDLKKEVKEAKNPSTDRYKSAENVKTFSGGGGLVSTIGDYYKFCQFLLNLGRHEGQNLLDSDLLNMMTENHISDAKLPLDTP